MSVLAATGRHLGARAARVPLLTWPGLGLIAYGIVRSATGPYPWVGAYAALVGVVLAGAGLAVHVHQAVTTGRPLVPTHHTATPLAADRETPRRVRELRDPGPAAGDAAALIVGTWLLVLALVVAAHAGRGWLLAALTGLGVVALGIGLSAVRATAEGRHVPGVTATDGRPAQAASRAPYGPGAWVVAFVPLLGGLGLLTAAAYVYVTG